MAKLALAVLFAVFALAAARQLHQSTALVSIAQLPKQLQDLNAKLAAATTSPKKAGVMSLIDSYEEYEAKYVKIGYKDGEKYAYAPDYERSYDTYDKYEAKDKYYGAAEDKYAYDKHAAEDKYAADKYEEKYNNAYEKHESYDKDSYGKDYGYGPAKVSIKLYEKYRSKLRIQTNNPNTFQFTSELTCQNPKFVEEIEKEHGVIAFPIMSDRMKLVTVGTCEWTVTLVQEATISEHAKLKGNTNVVCRFNEEAERHCHKAEDVLCDGMTVSGQGLVYNFEADTFEAPEEKKYAPKPDEYAKVAEAEEVDETDSLDVYLSLINGVVNSKKNMKWDNGAIQYFMGPPPTADDQGRDGTKVGAKNDPTGEYTFLFKN